MSFVRELFSKETWRVLGDTVFGLARWGLRGEWDFWEEQEKQRLNKIPEAKPKSE